MKNRVSRVGLSFSPIVIIALTLGGVPSSLTPAQGTQVKGAPLFDFSDAFYLQNGNNPAKPAPPPPSTGSSFARAYSVPYSYSVAESISQASSGGFVVGALCSAAAATTPNCNGPATVLRVDASGNIQSQTQYSYGNGPQSTALNILKATSDGGAIFAGQPQAGCPAQNLNSCGAIVKVDSSGKVQWANDLLFATSASPYSSPTTWPFDIQRTTDGG